MPIIGKLIAMYRMQDIDICTGLNSFDFGNLPSAPFTRFIKNGRSITYGLGIALQEIYLLENLFSQYKPANVLIIGNSQGWSTLAIGLLLPDSRVVAMDAGFDDNSLQGLDLTNRMAAQAGLKNVKAIKGVSPQHVAGIVDVELQGRIDFVFIDGLHTNAQVLMDYQAVTTKAAKDAVFLFHDVHAFNLYDGLKRIEAQAGRQARYLRATPSGLAMLFDPQQHPELDEAIAAFAPSEDALGLVRSEARDYGILGRIKRELRVNARFVKAVNFVSGLVGGKQYVILPE